MKKGRESVCFDTNFMILALKQEGHADMVKRACHALKEIEEAGQQLIIPAVTVGEMFSHDKTDRDHWVEVLHKRFLVVSFDLKAAICYARLWRERPDHKQAGITREKMKVDHMVAAIAITQSCTKLYTDDGALSRFVHDQIEVIRPKDIALPPDRPTLFDGQTGA
jgi:predicted nucleic acid-binding protein